MTAGGGGEAVRGGSGSPDGHRRSSGAGHSRGHRARDTAVTGREGHAGALRYGYSGGTG